MKIFNTIIIISILIHLYSCNNDSGEGKPVNIFGGAGRTNSYEEFGSFSYKYPILDKFEFKDSSGALTSPLVMPNSDIIVSTVKGNILLISQKQVRWSFRLDSSELPSASLAADIKFNIYVISTKGIFYSISKDGVLNWKKKIIDSLGRYDIFSDLLAQDDGIVTAVSNGIIIKIGFDGRTKWVYSTNLSPTKTFAADENGNLYFSLTNDEFGATDSLLALSSDGKFLWEKGFVNTRFIKSPSIINNKIYIFGITSSGEQKISSIIKLDNKGKLIWKKEILLFARNLSVDNDGKVYVIGYNSGIGEAMSAVFCFSSEGKLEWKKYFEVIIPSAPMISEKYIAFVVSDKNAVGVYFLKRDGTLYEVVSMENMPVLYLQPAVTSDPIIIFSGADELCMVSIDAPPFDKFLPW